MFNKSLDTIYANILSNKMIIRNSIDAKKYVTMIEQPVEKQIMFTNKKPNEALITKKEESSISRISKRAQNFYKVSERYQMSPYSYGTSNY